MLGFEQAEHVGGAADVVDGAVLRVVLAEGLALAAGHRPEDGAGEEVEPVAGLAAGAAGADLRVRLLAGQEHERVVGEPLALGEHRLHLGQPDRAGVAGVAVAVELGQVDDVHVHVLEHFHEVGRRPPLARLDLLQRRRGDGHVPVAGERHPAGERREAVAVGELEDFLEGVVGPPAAQQVKHAEPLRGAGRGVEPGGVVAASGLGLADAEPGAAVELAVIAARPDGLLVVGIVARVKELVRRREARD